MVDAFIKCGKKIVILCCDTCKAKVKSKHQAMKMYPVLN
jgi:hypothetical protein